MGAISSVIISVFMLVASKESKHSDALLLVVSVKNIYKINTRYSERLHSLDGIDRVNILAPNSEVM